MTFTRNQLSEPAKLNAIGAVAQQKDGIDTTKLAPEQRVQLLRVLAADATFKDKHRDLLMELANEVKADRGGAPPATERTGPAVSVKPEAKAPATVPTKGATAFRYDTASTFDAYAGTFESQSEADSTWKSATSGFRIRKVIGDYPDATKLSLDYTLFRFTKQSRTGTELRWLIPVLLGPAAPTLPVVMSWDNAGTATIRLVSETGVRPEGGRATTQQLTGYLEKRGVKVADVKSWTAGRLEEFVRALRLVDKLDPGAVTAVKGLVLKYSAAAPRDSPHQEAVFEPEAVSRPPTMTVRASAFELDETKFVGSVSGELQCRSTMTIAHELGHAVETEVARRLEHASDVAAAEQNSAYDAFFEAKTRYVQGGNAAKAAIHELYGVSRSKSADLANAYAAIYEVADDKFDKAVDAVDAVTTHGREATLDATLIGNATKQMAAAATTVAATVRAQQEGLTGQEIQGKPLILQLATGYKELVPLLAKLGSAARSVRDAKVAMAPAVYLLPGGGGVFHSRRLQNFVDYVTAMRPDDQTRVIGITAYATDEWRKKKPGETFAEAYALWLTDRPFLTRVAPEFVNYFSKGMHLK
jgi:hypothetical protein